MQENMRKLLRAAGIVAVGTLAATASADDWTVPGAACQTSLGSGGPNGNHGYEADTGGSTVVVCPLLRKNGTDNLNDVWVRYQRTGGNSSSFINCTVLASNSFGGSTDTVWKQPGSGSAANTLLLEAPDDVVSGGYISVMCVVGPGDTIHGVRYTQD